jgi:hypothetical protein
MEGNVLEAERGVVRGGARVFPGTKEEVECDGAHVGHGLAIRKRVITKGLLKDVNYDDDEGGFYPR